MADKIYIKHNLGNFNQPYIARSTVNAQNPIIAQQSRRQPAIYQQPSEYNHRQPSTYRDPVNAQNPFERNAQTPFNRSYRTPNAVSVQVPFTYPTIAQQPAIYQHQSPSIYTAQAQIPSIYQHQSPYIAQRVYTFQSPAIYQHQSPYTFQSPAIVRQPAIYSFQSPGSYQHRSPYTVPATYSHRTPVNTNAQYTHTANYSHRTPASYVYRNSASAQQPTIVQSPNPVTVQNGAGSSYYIAGRNDINSPGTPISGSPPLAHSMLSTAVTTNTNSVKANTTLTDIRFDHFWNNGTPQLMCYLRRPTGSGGAHYLYDEINTFNTATANVWNLQSIWTLPTNVQGFTVHIEMREWNGTAGTVSGIQPVLSWTHNHTSASFGNDISTLVGARDPNNTWSTGSGAYHGTKNFMNGSTVVGSSFSKSATMRAFASNPGGQAIAQQDSFQIALTDMRNTGGNTATFTQSNSYYYVIAIDIEDGASTGSTDIEFHEYYNSSTLIQSGPAPSPGGGGGGGGFTPFTPGFQSFYQEPLSQELNRNPSYAPNQTQGL